MARAASVGPYEGATSRAMLRLILVELEEPPDGYEELLLVLQGGSPRRLGFGGGRDSMILMPSSCLYLP